LGWHLEQKTTHEDWINFHLGYMAQCDSYQQMEGLIQLINQQEGKSMVRWLTFENLKTCLPLVKIIVIIIIINP
jgi:hypothetical protein